MRKPDPYQDDREVKKEGAGSVEANAIPKGQMAEKFATEKPGKKAQKAEDEAAVKQAEGDDDEELTE